MPSTSCSAGKPAAFQASIAARAEDSGLPEAPHLSQSGAFGPGVAEAVFHVRSCQTIEETPTYIRQYRNS